MIKISHETPVSILEKSNSYNDYGYALAHLLEENKVYYDYYKNYTTRTGKELLLDNSIFELGTSFKGDQYRNLICDVRPDYYIVPDVLEDADGTIDEWVKWDAETPSDMLDYKPLRIGVVQGKTYDDIVRCYNFMSWRADYIAISFDYSYYQYTGLGVNKLERMCEGRPRLIKQLVKDGVWNNRKPHHLLGASLAKEFRTYTECAHELNIRSLDTSNPVVAGLFEKRYVGDLGLAEKPSTKLADLISAFVNENQWDCIDYNTKQFRNIVAGL